MRELESFDDLFANRLASGLPLRTNGHAYANQHQPESPSKRHFREIHSPTGHFRYRVLHHLRIPQTYRLGRLLLPQGTGRGTADCGSREETIRQGQGLAGISGPTGRNR